MSQHPPSNRRQRGRGAGPNYAASKSTRDSDLDESTRSNATESTAAASSDGWNAPHSDATKRRYVMEAISGGRLAAYGGVNQFALIPFMPEDNHSSSTATQTMTRDLEVILSSKSEYVRSVASQSFRGN